MSDLAPPPVVRCQPEPETPPGIIDLEASGFGRHGYPIEIGYVLGDGSSYCSLITPAPGWTYWDPAAEKVHGIARDTLLRHGRPVREVAAKLNLQLPGRTLYTDGWAHDYTWLSALFDEAGLVPSFRIDSLRSLLSDEEAGRWHATKARVTGECSLARHRASVDAWLLQQTWLRVRAEAIA